MRTLRRVLTAAALVVAAAGLASAAVIPTITFGGCTAVVGGQECTVTQSGQLGTPGDSTGSVPMNIVSPASLYDFDYFGQLGLPGNAQLNGASFDYAYDTYATSLSVTNTNTTNSVQVNFALGATTLLDPGTNMPGCTAGVAASGANDCHLVEVDMQNVSNAGATGTANNIFAANNVVLTAGQVMPVAPPTQTFTNGVSFYTGGTGNPLFGCNTLATTCYGVQDQNLTVSNYTGGGTFSFGTTSAAAFTSAASGNGGSASLAQQYTTTFDSEAVLTYDYFIPTGTPEPTTMVLMGSALVGLGLLGRRRLNKR